MNYTVPKKDERVHVEEIFLDAENLAGFDQSRFEGVMEQPIRASVFVSFGILFLLVGLLLLGRGAYLTLEAGEKFALRAGENHLRHSTIIPERGIVYDRHMRPLAFNVPGFRVVFDMTRMPIPTPSEELQTFAELMGRNVSEVVSLVERERGHGEIVVELIRDWELANQISVAFKNKDYLHVEPTPLRDYVTHPAFSHIIGYVSRVTEDDVATDQSAFLWGFTGKSGIERTYDTLLRGTLGMRIVETDSQGKTLSEGIFRKEDFGKGLVLTISSDFQEIVYEYVSRTVEEQGFRGGSAVALDAVTGEVLALVSYPGFNIKAFSEGGPAEEITYALQNEKHPLFFRAISGLYPPASTVKPFLALGAIEEGIIDPQTIIHTTGQLVVPNPYNPARPAIFKDWKNHGAVNMRQALAVSSDVYFWTIGGGYGAQEGLGLQRIRSYLEKFGFGDETGIDLLGEETGSIPDEAWKKERYPDDPAWRIGDTYNISIGQGGLLVTPLQMARSTLALARGELLQPHVVKSILDANGREEQRTTSPRVQKMVEAHEYAFTVVREGMREAVQSGTARGVADLPVEVAAKTGTAEVGKTGRIHSWFIGYLPADNPALVLVINLEEGKGGTLIGATSAARYILGWYVNHANEVR